jgi:oleandomycin transport system ATP-binding protein
MSARPGIGGQVLEVRPADAADLERGVELLGGLTGSPATVDRGVRRIGVPMADPAWLPVAVRRLDEAGIAVIDLGLRRPSLDEVFLALTDHPTAAPPSEPRQAPGRTAA